MCLGGRELAIRHTGPTGKPFETVFLHLSRILVAKGQEVVQGQVVARSGGSSNCDENGVRPHLHFHLWSGKGSRDSHTIPFERLVLRRHFTTEEGGQIVVRGPFEDFHEYDAKGDFGDLDNRSVAGEWFGSNNSRIEASNPP